MQNFAKSNLVLYISFCSGVLDIGGGAAGLSSPDSEVMATQKYAVIAGVLASPPSAGKYSDLEEYYRVICPQLLDLLALKVIQETRLII